MTNPSPKVHPMSFDKQHVMGAAAEASEPALVSDQAPSGLAPTGFDQAQVDRARDMLHQHGVGRLHIPSGDGYTLALSNEQGVIDAMLAFAALEASSRQEERLRLALQPFVAHWQPWMDGPHWSDDEYMSTFSRVTYGDLRRARAALEPPHAKEPG